MISLDSLCLVKINVCNSLVGLAKQTLETEEHSLSVVGGRPLVLENIQADATGEVNIRMVYGRLEENSRWSVWVVGREGKAELES